MASGSDPLWIGEVDMYESSDDEICIHNGAEEIAACLWKTLFVPIESDVWPVDQAV